MTSEQAKQLRALADRVEAAAEHMHPANHHDTPDYAEITGPAFMMMTVQPAAIMGLLDALPEIILSLRAHASLIDADTGEARP